jgi:hypothetical protein
VFYDTHVSLRKQVGDVLLIGSFRWIMPRTIAGSPSRFYELLGLVVGVGLPNLELLQIFGLPKMRDCYEPNDGLSDKRHLFPPPSATGIAG